MVLWPFAPMLPLAYNRLGSRAGMLCWRERHLSQEVVQQGEGPPEGPS